MTFSKGRVEPGFEFVAKSYVESTGRFLKSYFLRPRGEKSLMIKRTFLTQKNFETPAPIWFYRLSRFYRFYRIYRLYRYHRFYRFYTCATQRDRQHSHHTQRENKSTDGGLAPIGTFVRARSARAPLCVV